MEHQGTQTLLSKRLILRQFTIDDCQESFNNWCNDALMCKYLTWQPHKSLVVTQNIFQSWISQYSQPNFYQYAITLKENNEIIGTISVVSINEAIESMTIGYCIGSKYWNHGYTSEALATLMNYLFTKVKVNRIESAHDINSIYSGSVMRKCGLRYEGTLHKADKNNLGTCDIDCYGLLSNEYFNNEYTNAYSNQEIVQSVTTLCDSKYTIASLANIGAYIYQALPCFNWVGFYFLENNELVLGPFQGKVACTPLKLTKGVCAHCVKIQEIVVVNDIKTFKDHIACDSLSRSECVLPIQKNNQVKVVLDIDSPYLNRFNSETIELLKQIQTIIQEKLF